MGNISINKSIKINSEELAKMVIAQIRTGTYEDWVLKISAAMTEYRSIGEREAAIGFANFIDRNQYKCMGSDGDWRESNGTPVAQTTEQLYEIYK